MSYSKKMSGILFETQCTSQCLLFTFILLGSVNSAIRLPFQLS